MLDSLLGLVEVDLEGRLEARSTAGDWWRDKDQARIESSMDNQDG